MVVGVGYGIKRWQSLHYFNVNYLNELLNNILMNFFFIYLTFSLSIYYWIFFFFFCCLIDFITVKTDQTSRIPQIFFFY